MRWCSSRDQHRGSGALPTMVTDWYVARLKDAAELSRRGLSGARLWSRSRRRLLSRLPGSAPRRSRGPDEAPVVARPARVPAQEATSPVSASALGSPWSRGSLGVRRPVTGRPCRPTRAEVLSSDLPALIAGSCSSAGLAAYRSTPRSSGAKEVLVALRILPYLVAILVMTGPPRPRADSFAPAIRTARVGCRSRRFRWRCLAASGSGAYGVMVVKARTARIPPGYLVSTIQGSSETTFTCSRSTWERSASSARQRFPPVSPRTSPEPWAVVVVNLPLVVPTFDFSTE